MSNPTTTNNDDSIIFHKAVKENDFELVSKLLETININIFDSNKKPPLYYAVLNSQWKMVQFLLENNAKIHGFGLDYQCRMVLPPILHRVVADINVEDDFVDFIIAHKDVNIDYILEDCGHTPIYTAVSVGNIRIVKKLLTKYKPNLKIKSFFRINLIHQIFRSNISTDCKMELLELMIAYGIDINGVDDGSENGLKRCATPLTYALYYKMDLKLITKLMELGAHITTDYELNRTVDRQYGICNIQDHLIQAASIPDDFTTFDTIIQSCPNPTASRLKLSLKRLFATKNYAIIIRLLTIHWSKINEDKTVINILQYTFPMKESFSPSKFPQSLNIFQILFNKKVKGWFNLNDSTNSTTIFMNFVQDGAIDLPLLQLLVQNGADIHCRYITSWPSKEANIIHELCTISTESIDVQTIIDKIDYFAGLGVDINLNQMKGGSLTSSPLHCAVQNQQFGSILVPYLIQQHHVNIELLDQKGCIPLHYVRDPQLVPLLATQTNIDIKNQEGHTPLFRCIASPNIKCDTTQHKIITMLLNHNADINIGNKNGQHILHILFDSSVYPKIPLQILKLLVQHPGININAKYYSQTTLELAKRAFYDNPTIQSKEAMMVLLEAKIDPTLYVDASITILHYIMEGADCFGKLGEYKYYNDELLEDVIEAIISAM